MDLVKIEPLDPDRGRRGVLWTCPDCNRVYPDTSRRDHIRIFHTPGPTQGHLATASERLPFTLLPPGEYTFHKIIEHYRKIASASHFGWAEHKVDWKRLEAIEALNPSKYYVGKDGWTGYVIFAFQWSDKGVLECPREGNAIYVLRGDWRAMVTHSKGELREEYQHLCQKIVHKGEWLNRIRQALR